jgi:hypothetical protein
MLEQGMFETNPSYYNLKAVFYCALFFGALYMTILRPSVTVIPSTLFLGHNNTYFITILLLM